MRGQSLEAGTTGQGIRGSEWDLTGDICFPLKENHEGAKWSAQADLWVEFFSELRRGSKTNLPCSQLWVKITNNEIK